MDKHICSKVLCCLLFCLRFHNKNISTLFFRFMLNNLKIAFVVFASSDSSSCVAIVAVYNSTRGVFNDELLKSFDKSRALSRFLASLNFIESDKKPYSLT